MNERPLRILIEEEYDLRSGQPDDVILAELQSLPILPDEDIRVGHRFLTNPHWDDPYIRKQLAIYLAIADLVYERKLRAAVPLLLERASYGDMGETMRGLRHSLEAAYHPDWDDLNAVCLKMAQSPHNGARLWAIDELGILRNPDSVPTLLQALRDSMDRVREQAVSSLKMLCYEHPDIQTEVIQALQELLKEFPDNQKDVQDALKAIQKQQDDASD